MKPGVVLNFPPGLPVEVKNKFIQSVNIKLDPIISEVNNWNGFIDLKKINEKDYHFVPICDNEDIRLKMELLLGN